MNSIIYNNNKNTVKNNSIHLVNSSGFKKNSPHFEKNTFTNDIKKLHNTIEEFFKLINENKINETHIIIQYYLNKRVKKINKEEALNKLSILIENLNNNNFSIDKKNNMIRFNKINYTFKFQKLIEIKDIDIKKMLLLFINIVRLYYVDKLLNIITTHLSCTTVKSLYKFCNVVEIGSIDLTSNYDITVNGVIYSEYIVQLFNFIFYSFWNDYSSNVFDTNIYGSTFFISIPTTYFPNSYPNNLYSLTISSKYNKRILYLSPNDEIQKNIFINQLKWLLLKIECHKIEYSIDEIYTNKIISLLQGILKENVITNLTKEKGVLQPNQLYSNQNSTSNNNLNSKLLLKIREYEKCQSEIKIKESNYEKNKANESLIELIEVISKSNYYGMETYYCIGTIYHVLGYIQGLCDFKMNDYYYIESAIENYIDIFRYNKQLNNIDYTIDYVIIKMSKYAYRLYNALNAFNSNQYKEKEAIFQDIINKLKTTGSFKPNNSLKKRFIDLFGLNENNINFDTFISNIHYDIHNIISKLNI